MIQLIVLGVTLNAQMWIETLTLCLNILFPI